MSNWGSWGRFKTTPKKPPPEHGIKMKKAGTTWWGQRWIEALQDVLGGDSGRLARGRTYARAGRTHDLVIEGEQVTAKVTGSRPTPYRVTIKVTRLEDAAWKEVIAGMAAKAQFAAELLAGEMPKEIDAVFRQAGSSLFPTRREELTTSCTCPDWGDPCKHVAATHYVLGEALDRDPFLLFELRGRRKEQVLASLRTLRAGDQPSRSGASARESTPLTEREIPRVALGKIASADYDRPRESLPVLRLSFDAPATHGAVLRQLGVPAAWGDGQAPADVLAPVVSRAAELARRIAMADTEVVDQGELDASVGIAKPKSRRGRKPKIVPQKP